MAKKSLYTKELGLAVADRANITHTGRYHVIANDGNRWAVVPEGSVRAIRVFGSREKAVSFARQTAAKKAGEVFVHAESGQVMNRISFLGKSS